ncbi:MAG TPA: CapA family protein, partial [Steroidobacteraceae bacterium]|nr:CapA family protein [Steroidobacteraceae bacterium]
MSSALAHVELAERVSGPIPRGVDSRYIWGDAIEEWESLRPEARIINLETAVTTNHEADPSKQIHYRMHPANVACLTAARIDCCVLANNHVLDWGRPGLIETLKTLHAAGLRTAGAGSDRAEAAAPGVIEVPPIRLLVYGFGLSSSGVPRSWQATRQHCGVHWLADLSAATADDIGRQIAIDRRPGDLVVASIHWGGNWGYAIPQSEREFAHRLIDAGGCDLLHGHSSHHPKGIEIYRRKLILYGCGDLLSDYEGIGGYESFRPDLTLMYFPTLQAGSGELISLMMVPVRVHRFQLRKAAAEEGAWLAATMDRECHKLASRIVRRSGGRLALEWTD